MWYILATCDYFCCYYFANFQYYKKQVAQVAELAIIKKLKNTRYFSSKSNYIKYEQPKTFQALIVSD